MSAFDMTKPCANCPFRTDIPSYLRAARISNLEGSLVHHGASFTCHKTTVADEEEDEDGSSSMRDGPNAQHCAGALILLEKIGEPNQMMRIAERLGEYDPSKLDMDAPVFNSFEQMRRAQDDYEEPEHAEEPCHVSGHGCEAPAGWMGPNGVEHGTENAEFRCYECGEPMCDACSRHVGSKHLCEYCADAEEGFDDDDDDDLDEEDEG